MHAAASDTSAPASGEGSLPRHVPAAMRVEPPHKEDPVCADAKAQRVEFDVLHTGASASTGALLRLGVGGGGATGDGEEGTGGDNGVGGDAGVVRGGDAGDGGDNGDGGDGDGGGGDGVGEGSEGDWDVGEACSGCGVFAAGV